MKRPKTLSAAFVRTVNQPGRYGDGRGSFGLSLLLKATRYGRLAKSWSQRLRQGGKPFNVGLGRYPLVTLSEARLKALKNARDNAAGRSLRGDAIPTFSQAVDAVIALHLSSWRGSKTESEWRQSLAIHAFPMIGGKPVDAISTADILAVLAPIWSGKTETARRVLQRISIVLRWAIEQTTRPMRRRRCCHETDTASPNTLQPCRMPKSRTRLGRSGRRARRRRRWRWNF